MSIQFENGDEVEFAENSDGRVMCIIRFASGQQKEFDCHNERGHPRYAVLAEHNVLELWHQFTGGKDERRPPTH